MGNKLSAKNLKIDIALVNTAKIKSLNRSYFNKNRTTDIIAFNMNEDLPDGTYFLGELIISYPQIVKQAKEYSVSEAEEMARVVAHGVLHLLGYEDTLPHQRRKMKKTEDQVLARLRKSSNPKGV